MKHAIIAPHFFVRQADDGDFCDIGMFKHYILYFGREMILATSDDHFLDPPGNADLIALIHGAEVARV